MKGDRDQAKEVRKKEGGKIVFALRVVCLMGSHTRTYTINLNLSARKSTLNESTSEPHK